MSLVEHAKREMELAGIFDKDSDYGGMLGPAVMKLVEVFAAEGHSGMSANICLEIFDLVARFKALTPITSDPSEWMDVKEYGGPDSPAFWQNRRESTWFSTDGGKTAYNIDDPKREVKTMAEPKK